MNRRKKNSWQCFHGLVKWGIMAFCAGSLIIMSTNLLAGTQELSDVDTCILQILKAAPDTMTIGEARAECRKKTMGSVDAGDKSEDKETRGIITQRIDFEESNILTPFTLMAHNANYILLAAYNSLGWSSEEFEKAYNVDSIDLNDVETQFQLSIKTPVLVDLFDGRVNIFTAYTVRSFWQFYNKEISSPFRETNHEPELWVQLESNREFFGFKNTLNTFGIAHQSNGRGGSLSRSWNRVYASFGFERENFAFLIKPWVRIPEDLEDDDNPDITDFLGHGEFRMAYKFRDNTFSLMSRNNLESGFSRGAVELGWSFPLFNYEFIKGYIQYFSGYGESLIDYDHRVDRIGFGLLITDIL